MQKQKQSVSRSLGNEGTGAQLHSSPSRCCCHSTWFIRASAVRFHQLSADQRRASLSHCEVGCDAEKREIARDGASQSYHNARRVLSADGGCKQKQGRSAAALRHEKVSAAERHQRCSVQLTQCQGAASSCQLGCSALAADGDSNSRQSCQDWHSDCSD